MLVDISLVGRSSLGRIISLVSSMSTLQEHLGEKGAWALSYLEAIGLDEVVLLASCASSVKQFVTDVVTPFVEGTVATIYGSKHKSPKQRALTRAILVRAWQEARSTDDASKPSRLAASITASSTTSTTASTTTEDGALILWHQSTAGIGSASSMPGPRYVHASQCTALTTVHAPAAETFNLCTSTSHIAEIPAASESSLALTPEFRRAPTGEDQEACVDRFCHQPLQSQQVLQTAPNQGACVFFGLLTAASSKLLISKLLRRLLTSSWMGWKLLISSFSLKPLRSP